MGIPAGSEVEVKIQKELTSVVQSGAMEVSISNELLEFEQEPEPVESEPEVPAEPDEVTTSNPIEPESVVDAPADEPDDVHTTDVAESEPDSEVDSEDEDL